MDYIKELYIDEKLKNPENILASIKRKENVFNVYLICVDKQSKNIVDIMPTYEAFAERNSRKEITLIGVAYGRRGAYELFKRMVEDHLKKGHKMIEFKDRLLQ
ncbi:MAG: hypothetical protein E7235_05975 [Lachnospiraceae bacterium]|nr:hypothetical protein [Lachnospiraceae bacterium]